MTQQGLPPATQYSEGSQQYRQLRNQENAAAAQQAGLSAGTGAQQGSLTAGAQQYAGAAGAAGAQGGLTAGAQGAGTSGALTSGGLGGASATAGTSPAAAYQEGSAQYRQLRNQENAASAQQAGLTQKGQGLQ